MNITGSSVGVIGGSIAGCAAAIALTRLGCDVTILERSSAGLKDRGSGIAVPIPLRDELVAAGYLPTDYPTWQGLGRRWYVADGSASGDLRWEYAGVASTNNWGELWQGLRANVPANVEYLEGNGVTGLRENDGGVDVEVAGGGRYSFDVVFGADGYRSVVRSHLHPSSAPHFAGYILWRGNFPADRLTDRDAFEEILDSGYWLSVGFDGGHAVMYPIPDFADHGDGLRVNWAIYARCPDGLALGNPSSIPPGEVEADHFEQYERLVEAEIPPRLRPLFRSPHDEVSIQPIYDELVDSYVSSRLALIGDAATLSRPHTGSGATKAMQDARVLETLGASHTTWPDLLHAYDTNRSAAGRSLVELGRRIGRDQVEQTPPWHEMTPADFEAWTAGTLRGESLYFWGDEAKTG